MERVRVSPDGWTFVGVETGDRMVPFGANFVFQFGDGQRSLDIMTAEKWEPAVVRRAFQAAAECGMNLMKVFLPIPALLPDPQPADRAAFAALAPSLWQRLEWLFEVARETGVYVSLSLAEWGMWNAAWFHEGGEFFGRPETTDDGPDSYAILADLWRGLAAFAKDEDALLSYSLAVELYIPEGNWGGTHPERRYLFADRWALEAWRRWLRRRYGSVAAVNAAWGTTLGSLEEIDQPEIRWLPARGRYTRPLPQIADYIAFKECVIYLFLRNQVEAIRSVDDRHLVTCGIHPDQPGISPMGFAWKVATPAQRDLDMFDYLTVHLYTQLQYLIYRPHISSNYEDQLQPFMADEKTLEMRRRECLLYARFLECGKPIVAEEFGHLVRDFDESLTGTTELMRRLSGSVSGFQLWSFGADEKTGDWGPMGTDLTVNAWGREWQRQGDANAAMLPAQRTPARTIIKVDRLEGLAPASETAAEKVLRCWDGYLHPVDFDWPGNPMIAEYRQDGTTKL